MGFIFNFIKRILKLSIKLSLYLAIFVGLVVLIPNLPPYTKFTSIELAPTQPRVGPLAPNNILNNAEKLYKGKLLGPEAFQLFDGELYTSLATGEIVKISPGGHITFVTQIGQPCTGLSKEHICGRPLGIQIDDTGKTLYTTDAYHGIWKVDLKTGAKQLLVSPRVPIDKLQPKLFNSLAVHKNGDIYWTDSSSDFQLKDGAYTLLADPSGRAFYYNAAKNESKLLVDGLWFPNGIIISPSNEFVVISETARFKLVKHYISGPNKGKTETFVDGLPGTPDNLQVLPDGSGFLVGLYSVFDEENPMLTRSMSNTPIIRKFLARLHRLIEIPFEYLNSVYPHVLFEDIVYHIGHFKSVSGLSPPTSGLLQVDWNGNIVASYYNTDGTLGHISDGIVYNDKLYTGNPHKQDFIGAVPAPPLLKKAFQSSKRVESPKVETKPQVKPVEQAKPKQQTKPAPKVEEKPKPAEKSKVEQQPKVETKPKQEPKPKVVEKKDVPKVAKPDIKPPQQAKPVENAKPVVKPNVEAKASQQAPKTTPSPPPTTPPQPSKPQQVPKKSQGQDQPKPTTPKPESKATPASKPTDQKTTTPRPKTTEKTPEEPKKEQKPVKPAAPSKPQGTPKEQIPIKEEIPMDTKKPTEEKLKVIKKGGVPTELPAPNH